MVLSTSMSNRIVSVALKYVGRSFDYEKFNCVHFVRVVYSNAGIELPLIRRDDYPPTDFHLSADKFDSMPIGHSVFLKRKTSLSTRPWTHIAIIISSYELIHCSRHCGKGVVITSKIVFMETYALVLKPSA